MRTTTLFVCLSLATIIACKKSEKSRPKGDGPTEGSGGAEDGGDDDEGGDDAAQVGTLAVDMTGATAMGIAIIDSSSALPIEGKDATTAGQVVLSLTDAAETTLLTKVKTDGSIVGIELPDLGTVRPEIKKLTPVGANGLIVALDGDGYIKDESSAMLWIQPDGKIVPFAPADYADGKGDFFLALRSQPSGDKFWVHNVNQNALWSFDFASKSFAKFTDETQVVSGFMIPDADGSVFVQMSLLNTNAAQPPMVLRRLKPNGGFEDFQSAYGGNQIDDSMVFKDRVIIYGQQMGVNDDGDMGMSFLPEHLYSSHSGRSDVPVIVGGEWVAGHMDPQPFAFDLGSEAIAGNPFKKTLLKDPHGATPATAWWSRVSGVGSKWFDGANIVTPAVSGSTVTTSLVTTLTYPRGRYFKVVRVFGDDYGYTGADYGAYAISADGKCWYVELDKATGAVKSADARQIDLTTWSVLSGATPAAFAQGTSVYKLAEGLVVLAQMSNGNGLAWLDEDGGVLEFTAKQDASALGLWATGTTQAMNHAAAVVHNGDLYVPTEGGVKRYDRTADSFSNTLPSFAAILGEDCTNDRFVGGLMLSAANAVTMVLRTCHSVSASRKIAYVETNWTFDSAANAVDLAETQASTDNLRWLPEPLSGTAFLKRLDSEIMLTGATVDVDDVVTTGLVSFGAPLVAGSGIAVAGEWADDAFFISGKNGVDEHRSYRVEPVTRAETPVSDLNGVQVYSATRIGSTFLVNGLRLTDNVKVTYSYDLEGTKTGQDEVSNVKIVQLVPYGQ